ncbi:hypothetical protein [Paenibacillus sp. FSL R10-2734]|uniref:hypothetical protein n=1 Tax=Paenibacillus sp. FSL R10-2734 TaxID=2954691 RepID=UPI0030DA7663
MAETGAEYLARRRRELQGGQNKNTTETGEEYLARRRKELSGEIKTPEAQMSSKVLQDTLSSVLKPNITVSPTTTSATVQQKPQTTQNTVDFKDDQAAQKAKQAQTVSPLQGKLPAADLLTGKLNNSIQSTLKGKVPASSLLQQTGGGPANASQIPGISQYETTKKEIANDNAPAAVKAYANVMNYATQGNPIGQAITRSFQGNSGVTSRDTTGNKTVDKVTDVINNLVTPFITPTGAPLGQGIIGSTYDATGKALSGKIGQSVLKGAGKVIPGSDNVVRVAATEGLAGGLQGVGFGLQQGQDSGSEIMRNALYGAAAGGVLGGAGTALGEAIPSLLNMFRKSGVADEEIADIAPELLALPEANSRTVRKQLSGEIKTTPSGETIYSPYNLKLNEATPETVSASLSRQSAGREAIKTIDPLAETRYQQSIIDEYKRLKSDPDIKLTNKKTYELAVKNMEQNKPNNPIVERKLKNKNVSAVKPTPYQEPVIRKPVQELSREQQIQNKVNAGGFLPQEDIDYLLSGQYDKAKAFPEETPKVSTYVKPKSQVVYKSELKPKIKTEIKPKTEFKTKAANKEVSETTEKKKIKTEAKKISVSTDIKRNYEEKTTGIHSNYKTMKDSENISSKLKGRIEKVDQTYEIQKNVDTVAKANENIKNLSKAENDFLMNQSGGAEHISTGYRVMQELDKVGEHARALSIADKLAKDLTKAGQTAQAASLISRLSPEGQLLNLIRVAEKNGKVVDVADSAKFKELATKVQENTGAGVKENAINDILNRLEKGESVTANDIKALGDYIKNAEQKIQPKAKEVKNKLPKELNDTRKRDKVVSFLESQEEAAQARINKRKGRLNSLPVEEWIDYSILIAAKVGKGIIKAETYVEDLVKLFGEDIKPIAREVFEKAQDLVGSVTKGSIEGDFIKADNAFKRITGKASMNQQERIVEKYVIANPKVTPNDIDSLRKLAKSLTELQGTDKIKADMSMQKILNSYEKSSVMDKVNALRYIAMLYNSGTQAINAISGPIMATTGRTADVFGAMIDATLSKAMKHPRTTTLYGGNPVKFMADYFKGLKIGAKAGWEGVNPAGIQGANEIRGLTYKSLYNPLSLLERSLGSVAKGADYAAYSAIYKGELEKQGFLDALENGIKRSDKEGIKKHIRKFINDPSEAAIEQADRIAKNATFQRSDTTGGKIANFLNTAPPLVKPAVNAVFPFVRTPVNIASTAFTMSPGGIIKGLMQLSGKSAVGQREAIRTLSLGLTGTGLSAVGYYLNQLGIITGANDSGDKNADNIREQAGKGKYRFNTSALQRYVSALLNGEGSEAAEKAAKYQKGDKAFDYNKLQPVAFPLAIGAEFSDLKGRKLDQRISGTAVGAGGSLFGMSTLKGVQDVFQPSYGGTQGEKAAGVGTRLAESFFKSFSPSMLAQEARRQDPIARKTPYNNGLVADVKGYFQSRTPGLSKDLPANKTTLGQNKMNAPGIKGQYLNPYKSEVANYTSAAAFIVDLMERTGDNSIAPKAPEKKVRGKDENDVSVTIEIPLKRYEKLQEDIGNEIINRVMEIESGTDEEYISQLEEIYKDVRKEYMDEVKEELGLQVN